MSEIWVEKYRPKTLDEVVGQRHIVGRLKILVKRIQKGRASMPHFLFCGQQGTGKTTVANAFITDLYGEDFKMLELNASDDRGIDVVRDKIKKYCRTSPWDDKLNIIFLDEADGLTSQAQEALRRTMERYSKNTRFILSCNYSNKIIEPIQSRCAILNFFPLADHDIEKMILTISKLEGLKIKTNAATTLGHFCRGDARQALNALHYLANSQIEEITDKDIYDHLWRIDVHELTNLLKLCILVKNVESIDKRLDEIDSTLQKFYEAGYTNKNIVDGMYLSVKYLKTKPRTKAKLMRKVGELDYRLTVGCTPDVQVRAFFYDIFLSKVNYEIQSHHNEHQSH